jgi:hypothetical protein
MQQLAKPLPAKLWRVVLLSLATFALATFALGTSAKAEVGVSVTIDQPGIYGRIDLGNVPVPELIYERPVVVEQVRVVQKPIYLHVPPGHLKNWSKHCHQYQACSRRVYFVKEEWYERTYVPAQRLRNVSQQNVPQQNVRQVQPHTNLPPVRQDVIVPGNQQNQPYQQTPHQKKPQGKGQGQGKGKGNGHGH